ncbi:MAG: HD domain-containing protein [Planctomycetota bacterium]|nr:HD domain-containing protein [Planctomycetota bacterium]
MKTIRDAVHGDIRLTDEECRLIDTPEVQRLRGIKQLGTANLVFPTAVHTRFDHSLGTCHAAQMIMDGIARRGGRIVAPVARVIRIAALLHDVTHVPFGHTFEDERRIFLRHDEGSRLERFLGPGTSELGRVLDRFGVAGEVKRILSHRGVGPAGTGSAGRAMGKRGRSTRCERAGSGRVLRRRSGALPPFASDIVSHTICADLFDYLRRDTYFCGLRQDYDERVFSYFDIDGEGRLVLVLGKDGVLRRDVLSEVLNLLRLRYNLSERVYYHHTKIASGAMLAKAVESSPAIDERFLTQVRDDELLAELEHGRRSTPLSKRLAAKLRGRVLFKRAYMVGAERADAAYRREGLVRSFHLDPALPGRALRERLRAESMLASKAGLPKDSVIIYCPREDVCLKEAAVRVVLPGGQAATLDTHSAANPAWGEVSSLNAKYRQLWKFFVFIDAEHARERARLASVCARSFGLENELDESC